jgi:hypothetical protein
MIASPGAEIRIRDIPHPTCSGCILDFFPIIMVYSCQLLSMSGVVLLKTREAFFKMNRCLATRRIGAKGSIINVTGKF